MDKKRALEILKEYKHVSDAMVHSDFRQALDIAIVVLHFSLNTKEGE